MRRASKVISTLALAAMALGTVATADAANLKARSATIDPATGYPTWYQDANNLALTTCLDNSGFCLPTGTALPLPANRADINPQNFPPETFYFLAEVAGGTSLGGTISGVLYVAALEAGFAANVVDGGQAVFTRIRIRADVTLPGTYVVTHPYGTDTFDVVTPGTRAINFSEDVPGLVANLFDASLTSRVGPFLTREGGLLTDTATGNRYIGNPNVPTTVVGGPNGNTLTITAPNGDNFTTNLFTLQGKVIGLDVAPKTSLDLGPTKIAIPALAQTVTVTNTTGNDILFGALTPTPPVGSDPLVANDFTVAASTAVGAAPFCANATLTAAAPGNTCSFAVSLNPAAVAQATRTATLLLAPTTVQPVPAVTPPLDDPPPVTMNLTGTATVGITATPASPHGTITMEPTAIVTPAGTAPAGTAVTFAATPSNAKFKVRSIEDNNTPLGTAATPATLPNVGPFTVNTGTIDHVVTATFMPSGDLDADGTLGPNDALKALKIVAGVQQADVDDPDNSALKVGPLVNGIPSAINAKVNPDIGDVLVILRRVIGLDTW